MSYYHQKRYAVREIGLVAIFIILLIPLIPSDYFLKISIIEKSFSLISVLMFLILITLTIIRKRFNFFILLSFIFVIWRIISSYYLSDSVADLSNSIRICTLILFINIYIKKYPKITLKALSIVFGIYIFINFLTLYLFPGGIYLDSPRPGQFRPAWFLGIDNQFAVFLIPSIILAILSSWYSYKRITVFAYIQIILVVATILKTFSATAVLALFFVLISIIFTLRKRNKSISFYNFMTLSIVYTIIWILLVRVNFLEVFQPLIVDLLDKDLTLSGRTRIWPVVFDIINESLIYGYGINVRVLVGHTYFVSHNMLLQTTLESGIIGLFLLMFCIVISGIKLQKTKTNSISSILVIGIFGILVGGLTEAYRLNYLILLLTLAYNVGYILDYEK